jgi:hypothetical protein
MHPLQSPPCASRHTAVTQVMLCGILRGEPAALYLLGVMCEIGSV